MPNAGVLAELILWLREHNFEDRQIAELLEISPSNLRTILTRWRQRGPNVIRDPVLQEGLDDFINEFLQAPSAAVRSSLGLRPEEDSVGLDGRAWERLSDLEDDIEQLGQQVWAHMAYGEAVHLLSSIRPRLGYASHVQRVRLLARLHRLKATSYVHIGRSWSAIRAGLLSLQASRIHYAESGEAGRRAALTQIAATALLISQAYLLRREPLYAERFLLLHWQASEANGAAIGADALRQRGAARFEQGSFHEAARYYRQAAEASSRKIDEGEEEGEHKILDLGFRQANVLPPGNWDGTLGALELIAAMPQAAGEEALRFSNNVQWGVAAGFCTDDARIHQHAYELLSKHQRAAEGFAQQATVSRLFELAPKLPLALRPSFVRFALYANALKDL